MNDQSITLRLPYPPSVNSLWRMGKGNWYATKALRDYKLLVKSYLNPITLPNFTLAQRLILEAIVYPPDNRRRDIDNLLKSTLDALQEAKLFDNDSQIKKLMIEMKEKSTSGEGFMLVTVSTMP